jgi:hypothetical protein
MKGKANDHRVGGRIRILDLMRSGAVWHFPVKTIGARAPGSSLPSEKHRMIGAHRGRNGAFKCLCLMEQVHLGGLADDNIMRESRRMPSFLIVFDILKEHDFKIVVVASNKTLRWL